MKIVLGQEVKDKVSGYTGIAVARSTYLQGCDRILVQAKLNKDGEVPEEYSFDEPLLEVVGDGIAKKVERPKRVTGGPRGVIHEGKGKW